MFTQSIVTSGWRRAILNRRARVMVVLAGVMLLALTSARADAHHGNTVVAGTYTVTDFGATTCVPKGKSGRYSQVRHHRVQVELRRQSRG